VEEMGAALVLADEKFASDAWIRALP
jgi:hypothetical protein